jgi:hypothetical protein
VRKLAYGRDLMEMTFERKFEGFKARIVRVVSVNTSSSSRGKDKRLEVVWPDRQALETILTQQFGGTPEAHKIAKRLAAQTLSTPDKAGVTHVSASGQVSESDILTISVPGISNKDQLLRIAQDLYEEIGRGEMGGSVQTRNLASFGGDNQDPDLLRLRSGDGVEMNVDVRDLSSSGPLVSYLVDSVRQPDSARKQELEERFGKGKPSTGKSDDLANFLIKASKGSVVELQKFFKVSNVKFDWSHTAGIAIAFDFQNFVVARADVTPSTGAVSLPAAQQTSGTRQRPAGISGGQF